jgi:transmembrane sensor
VLEGDVTLFTKNNGTQRVSARQVALVTAAGVEITSRLNASAEVAWLDGLLQVSDRPLRDVVAALRDYRQGELVLDERIADRRLSGVFSLDDTDKALRAIARTLDVRVRIVSDHITRIEPRLS